MAHIGVKNRTDEDQVLTFDGNSIFFKPEQVKIVEGVPAGFIESRMYTQHKKNSKGEMERHLVGIRVFDVVPLADALKVASPEEDPAVVRAREQAEADKKAKAALFEEFKANLVADGWQPPKSEKEDEKTVRGKK